MEHRPDDLRITVNNARTILENREPPDDQHSVMCVYISMSPSFASHVSWTIFSDETATSFVLRRIEWNKPFDLQRFRNPMVGLKYGWHTAPAISSQIAELSQETIQTFIDEAQNMTISEPTNRGITLDGTRWSIFVDKAFNNKVKSWNTEPPEWKALIEWTSRLIRFIDDFTEIE
ncbi:MAG TPA: hypothetical protein VHL11_13795 [Phototrophicaceae bacterium]|nr:hypothetical protein [Phototrophicaceae bacterium]